MNDHEKYMHCMYGQIPHTHDPRYINVKSTAIDTSDGCVCYLIVARVWRYYPPTEHKVTRLIQEHGRAPEIVRWVARWKRGEF